MKVKKSNKKFYIGFGIIVYLFLILIGCHTAIVMQSSDMGMFAAIGKGLERFSTAPLAIFPLKACMFKPVLLMSAIAAFGIAYLYVDELRNKHSMPGKESGSATWNTDLDKYNKAYVNSNPDKNMILTQDVFLNMDSHKTRRNCNVCVVGGSGSGKSRFLVKPNILQANCNYVITDPAGELLETTGGFLKSQGYEIKVFNLVEMEKSDCYNPFNYIRDDLGVLMMINCLIRNTNPDGKAGGGDPFWEKSEVALLQALCFYLIKYRPKEDQNFTSVMKLLRAAEIDENNPNNKSPLDKIFDEVERTDPTSIALKQYKTFKMGAGKTLKSILISCSVRLTVFNLKQIESLTGKDTLDLASMGDGKKALFVIIPAADSTYNFLVSMMYSQLFETLYYVAETQKESKRLDSHVRFLLDEFANIGQIPDFTKKLSTMRKYEISCTVILQTLAQLKTMYKDDWETICGNCDSFLFLGGQEQSTLKYISEMLGKATIVVRNRSMSQGKSGSSSKSFNASARSLMDPDEIAKMPNDTCILMIRGLDPFYGKKYDYEKHKNYSKTGDAKNEYKYNADVKNSDIVDENEAAANVEEFNAIRFTNKKIFSDFKNTADFIKSENITSPEDVFNRFLLIEPDDGYVEPMFGNNGKKKPVEQTGENNDRENGTANNITNSSSNESVEKQKQNNEINDTQIVDKISADKIYNNDAKAEQGVSENTSENVCANNEKMTEMDDVINNNKNKLEQNVHNFGIDSKDNAKKSGVKTIKISEEDDGMEEFSFDD